MQFYVQTSYRCAAIAIVMLALASAGAVGQVQQPATQEPPSASNTGAITGKVVNESGQGLPNVSVRVRAISAQGPGEIVNTDRDGGFKASGLQRGPHTVLAYMPAYTPLLREPENRQPTLYQVGDSITLVLIRGRVLTGKVTTSEGEPVVAIGVRVEMLRDGNGRRITSTPMYREGPTDDRGIYRIYGLPAGTYIVGAGGTHDYSRTGINAFESNIPTHAPSSTRETAAEITVRAGEETTDVDIRYRAEFGRTISGIVSGPVHESSGFVVTLTSIDDRGAEKNDPLYQEPGTREFVFTGIADGDYYLTAHSYFEKDERVVSESKVLKIRSADVTGIDLVVQPMGSVSGRVVLEETKAIECTEKDRPVFTDTAVSAWHKEQEAAKGRARFIWSYGAPGRADAQGNVTLRFLAAGDYRFVAQFSAKSWYLRSISFAPSATKTPSTKPIDAAKTWTTIKPGDRLKGLTVTLAQGAATLQGQVALGAGETITEKLFVYLVPVEREKADDVLRFYAVAVTPEGKFVLNNLAPGRYWTVAQPPIDGVESPLTKLRLPDETEIRARLRRAAEAAKTEIELKPCQKVDDLRVPGSDAV